MTATQEQFDDLLGRTALAALFYYPEIAVDDDAYDLQKDIDHCMEPVGSLLGTDADQLRSVVGRVITNPSQHRSELLALVMELVPRSPAG